MFDHASDEEQDQGVFAQVTFAIVEADSEGGKKCPIEVFDGYADLPAFVAGGSLYIQAPLGYILETFTARLPDGKRYMEVRISEARRASLPFTCIRRSLHGKRMA